MRRRALGAAARWVYDRLTDLLPRRLDPAMRDGLRATFADGEREHRTASLLAYGAFVCREWVGLASVLVAARLRAARGAPVVASTARGRPFAALGQDIRFAARNLARHRSASGLAILTFAVGIGASSAMFGVVDAVLLRPLPYPDAHELVAVYPTYPEWRGHPTLGGQWDRTSLSYPEWSEWRAAQTSFVSAAGYERGSTIVTGVGDPERVTSGGATWELFHLLGATPRAGRLFDADDGESGVPVVIVSDGFWRTRLGADPGVVGRSITLNDRPHTVVGILPAWFDMGEADAALWRPIGGAPREADRNNHTFRVIGRLANGVTLEAAQRETVRLFFREPVEGHDTHGANLVPLLEDVTREVRGPLVLLVAGSVVLLAVACANVAVLVLGAGIARQGELAIRNALGAARSRLVGQLVTESLVLAAVGGAVGVGLAGVATRLLVMLAPDGIPRIETVALDGRVVAFTVAATAACGVLFGLVPALSLSRTDLARYTKGSRTVTTGGATIQASLVVAELVLVTVLLVGAGLLTRTLTRLNAMDPGLATENVLTVRIGPPFQRFFGPDAPENGRARLDAYYREVARQLEGVPGVEAVSMSSIMPFAGQRANNPIAVEGYDLADGELFTGERYFVTGNYMRMMELRVREGRAIEPRDDRVDAPPVVVVNTAIARHVGGDVLGKRFTFWNTDYTIVGVVDEVRQMGLARDPGPQFYVPLGQRPGQSVGYLIRTSGNPIDFGPAVRARIWSVDPDVPVTSLVTMDERVRGTVAEQRYRSRLMNAFSGLAVFMALLGVYGVTSRSVARRTRELGIRIALGAEGRSVVGLVLRQGLRLAALGGALGLVVSLATTRGLESFLFGVDRSDPLTMLVVSGVVGAMALLASLAPALRATRVDVLGVLRD